MLRALRTELGACTAVRGMVSQEGQALSRCHSCKKGKQRSQAARGSCRGSAEFGLTCEAQPALCTTLALSALLTYQSAISEACGKLGCPLGHWLCDVLPSFPDSSKRSQSMVLPIILWPQLRTTGEGSVGGVWELLAASSRAPGDHRGLRLGFQSHSLGPESELPSEKQQKPTTTLLFL